MHRNLSKELFDSLPPDAMFWRNLYNKHDVSSCLAKVRTVSYKEIIVHTEPIAYAYQLENYG